MFTLSMSLLTGLAVSSEKKLACIVLKFETGSSHDYFSLEN